MQDILIRDIMTATLITIPAKATVKKALDKCNDSDIRHLPVLEDGQLIGIMSMTDVERIKHGISLFGNPKLEKYNRTIYKTTLVRSIMTREVQTVEASEDITVAYNHFKKHEYRALPVLENGKLVGIVTPMDMVDYFFRRD